MGAGKRDGVPRAERDAGEVELAELERPCEFIEIRGECRHRIAVAGVITVAMTALIERQHVEAILPLPGEVVPVVGVAGDPMQKDEGRMFRPAPVEIVQAEGIDLNEAVRGRTVSHRLPLSD